MKNFIACKVKVLSQIEKENSLFNFESSMTLIDSPISEFQA